MNTFIAAAHPPHPAKNTTGHDPRTAKLFEQTLRTPQPNRFQQLLGRTAQPLRCLDEVLAAHNLSHRYHAGTRAIAIDQIHGTLNRSSDFDTDFHPLNHAAKNRWQRVASAMLNGISLPPIEVIQVGDTYFVKDGHHRISVARALGLRYLDAVVEIWVEV